MKQLIVPAFALASLASPLAAEEREPSLMEQGAKLFFKGLMEEMEPAMRELEDLAEEMEPALRNFANEMGPALRSLLAEVEDWSVYEAPEILPNGDIIIRRKPEKRLDPEADQSPSGEIEL